MSTLLRGGTAVDERGEVPDAWLLLDGDTIAATGIGRDAPAADEVVELDCATVVPGFIDLHGHGAGGHAYHDGGAELAASLQVHRARGTTRGIVRHADRNRDSRSPTSSPGNARSTSTHVGDTSRASASSDATVRATRTVSPCALASPVTRLAKIRSSLNSRPIARVSSIPAHSSRPSFLYRCSTPQAFASIASPGLSHSRHTSA